MFKVLCILVASLCIAYAALTIGKPTENDDDSGCYIEPLKAMIPVGQSVPSKDSCMQYKCDSDMIIYEGCGAIAHVPPSCKLVEDKNKPFPECCPIPICE